MPTSGEDDINKSATSTSTTQFHANEITNKPAVEVESSNFFSAVRTKETISIPYIYDKQPKFDSIPPKLEMDYSRILNKPYFIQNVTWTGATGNLAIISIPSSILINKLASIPFDASVYYRAKVSAILQVAGTPMHQGLAIASVVPAAMPFDPNGDYEINTLMCCPHAFLNANESTPARIQVPFYIQGKFAAIDLAGTTVNPYSRNSDYADLVLEVITPLSPPTGGSTTVTISVHFMFDDLEFYVPHVDPEWELLPQGVMEAVSTSATKAIDGLFSVTKTLTGDLLDNLRGGVRKWTGLHNPEKPALCHRSAVQFRQNLNLVDTPSFFEKLDPYGDFVKTVDDYVFDTSVDEMAIAHLKSKPQKIGSFKVRTSDASGKLLWSRPISPIQEVNTVSYVNTLGDTIWTNRHTNLHQTLAYMSKYWKGSLKIHLQAVMSNFHYCKLIVARDYSPDQKMTNSYPTFGSVTNLLTETVEFSAGGQIQTFELPYCSPLNQLPCSRDFSFNALEHGVYYIYLYQPLVFNGTVSTEITFNVYLTLGDDFDYFGYCVDPMVAQLPPVFELPSLAIASEDMDVEESILEPQAAAFAEVSDQTALLNSKTDVDSESMYDLRPIKSVRDYVRRFIKVQAGLVDTTTFDSLRGLFQLPVADLIGLAPRFATVDPAPVFKAFDVPSRNFISKMFLGMTGGTKFKIVINGSTITEAWYVPPSFNTLSTLPGAGDVWTTQNAIDRDGSNVNATIAQMFKFPERLTPPAATQTAGEYSTQTVSMDRPNYFNVLPGYILKSDDGSDTNRVAHACSELEFTIPYFSPFRFAGDYSHFGYTDDPGVALLSTHGLGHIILRVAAPENYAPGVTTQRQAVTYEVFVANTDETRFGFQVSAPAVLIPGYKVGNEYFQLAASIDPYSRRSPITTVGGAPGFPNPNNAYACYYQAT